MKFIVRKQSYGDEVDIKLADETKDKIKKISLLSFYAAAVVGGVAYILHDVNNKPDPEE